MTIPVLILTWKRPREVSLLIDSLRSYKPSKLYIASDGPRKSSLDDSKLIHETRDLISCSIDWPCSVKHNYSSVHMGLKDRVISAISWFFSFEEMGPYLRRIVFLILHFSFLLNNCSIIIRTILAFLLLTGVVFCLDLVIMQIITLANIPIVGDGLLGSVPGINLI